MELTPRVVRLTQMKAERERSKTQMKDLELQLSEMHDELDQAKKAELIGTGKDALLKVRELRTSSADPRSGRDVCSVSARMWRSCAATVRRCCSRRRSKRSCFSRGRRS